MNFETCIPKNDPLILYLTASVKLMNRRDIKLTKKEGKWGGMENHIGIKMHAAALFEDYIEEAQDSSFINTSRQDAICMM
jgi:hypothetical protein